MTRNKTNNALSRFVVKAERFPKLLDALSPLVGNRCVGATPGDELVETFRHFGWDIYIRTKDGVDVESCATEFMATSDGIDERDRLLFRKIAPLAEDGSSVVVDIDGRLVRWEMRGGRLLEIPTGESVLVSWGDKGKAIRFALGF